MTMRTGLGASAPRLARGMVVLAAAGAAVAPLRQTYYETYLTATAVLLVAAVVPRAGWLRLAPIPPLLVVASGFLVTAVVEGLLPAAATLMTTAAAASLLYLHHRVDRPARPQPSPGRRVGRVLFAMAVAGTFVAALLALLVPTSASTSSGRATTCGAPLTPKTFVTVPFDDPDPTPGELDTLLFAEECSEDREARLFLGGFAASVAGLSGGFYLLSRWLRSSRTGEAPQG